MEKLGVGLFLPSDPVHLGLLAELIDTEADFFELSPESFWVGSSTGDGVQIHKAVELFENLRDLFKKPFVGHGLAYSLGTPLKGELELVRTADWLDAIKRSHDLFNFKWYSEHLGFTNSAKGNHGVLPLPLPYSQNSVDLVSDRLKRVQEIIPLTAFENSVFYFSIDDPMKEADFYNRICLESGAYLMLDLHNVYTHCLNFGLDRFEFIDAIDLKNVIQIHLSGGSFSEPEWLSSKKIMRLDSHDGSIPEEVFELYEYVLPRAEKLKGVIVERLNRTLNRHSENSGLNKCVNKIANKLFV